MVSLSQWTLLYKPRGCNQSWKESDRTVLRGQCRRIPKMGVILRVDSNALSLRSDTTRILKVAPRFVFPHISTDSGWIWGAGRELWRRTALHADFLRFDGTLRMKRLQIFTSILINSCPKWDWHEIWRCERCKCPLMGKTLSEGSTAV